MVSNHFHYNAYIYVNVIYHGNSISVQVGVPKEMQCLQRFDFYFTRI